jgi:hypothetical protein
MEPQRGHLSSAQTRGIAEIKGMPPTSLAHDSRSDTWMVSAGGSVKLVMSIAYMSMIYL